jgi:hypothetical protein
MTTAKGTQNQVREGKDMVRGNGSKRIACGEINKARRK